jgi:hypothetical protein
VVEHLVVNPRLGHDHGEVVPAGLDFNPWRVRERSLILHLIEERSSALGDYHRILPLTQGAPDRHSGTHAHASTQPVHNLGQPRASPG